MPVILARVILMFSGMMTESSFLSIVDEGGAFYVRWFFRTASPVVLWMRCYWGSWGWSSISDFFALRRLVFYLHCINLGSILALSGRKIFPKPVSPGWLTRLASPSAAVIGHRCSLYRCAPPKIEISRSWSSYAKFWELLRKRYGIIYLTFKASRLSHLVLKLVLSKANTALTVSSRSWGQILPNVWKRREDFDFLKETTE